MNMATVKAFLDSEKGRDYIVLNTDNILRLRKRSGGYSTPTRYTLVMNDGVEYELTTQSFEDVERAMLAGTETEDVLKK